MCIIDFSTYPMSKEKKKLERIWNSKGKRYKCARFLCEFCGKFVHGNSYSVVDGGKSCKECDNKYK